MLKLEKVTGGYANIPVLKDVTFEVADGELVGLIGLNGAGKSTLVRVINLLQKPTQGQVIVEGKDMVTLVTCHPYPHNYQRYLVYCERV